SPGVWIKMAKKGHGIDSVRYPEVLDCALCFGWIDGRREALDERYFLQRFTPRASRSSWSRINREKAQRLIEQGRLPPAGLRDVGGNLPALDAVRADVERAAVDVIVVGGDVASGPMPAETLDRLLELGSRALYVRGNADREVVDAYEAWAAGVPTREELAP